jgi:hypothetical protein
MNEGYTPTMQKTLDDITDDELAKTEEFVRKNLGSPFNRCIVRLIDDARAPRHDQWCATNWGRDCTCP